MEDGRWKMEDGRWKMEDGRLRKDFVEHNLKKNKTGKIRGQGTPSNFV